MQDKAGDFGPQRQSPYRYGLTQISACRGRDLTFGSAGRFKAEPPKLIRLNSYRLLTAPELNFDASRPRVLQHDTTRDLGAQQPWKDQKNEDTAHAGNLDALSQTPYWLILSLAAAALPAADLFEDATAEAGLTFRHQSSKTARKYLPETMSGGVAIFDANQDGWMDVFFVNGAQLDFPHPQGQEPDKSDPRFWNRFFVNQGDGTFKDETEAFGLQGRGYGMGAAVGDYDNDGFPDLLVTNAGTGSAPAAVLYRNIGGKRFGDVTAAANLVTTGWATSAGFFDYDRDGLLDLFIARYMKYRFDVDFRCGMETSYGRTYCHPDLFEPETSYLFRNLGDGTFEDASQASGIAGHPGKGLGVAFADYDSDGWIDIAVANDSFPQFLFHNQGDGTFEETALFAGTAYDEDGREFAGMGIAFEDLDNDGLPDIVATALSQEKYAFFHNAGDGAFEYRTEAATQLYSGWGVNVFDFDNDGRRDIFFANGHVMDNIAQSQPHLTYLQRPLLLRRGDDGFVDVSEQAGPIFQNAWAGRGSAVGDLDNDGDLDLVVSNVDGEAYLARNLSSANWLGVRLRGCQSNRDGIGAQIEVAGPEAQVQRRQVTTAGSYLSSRDPRVFIGLGAVSEVDEVTVTWPGGALTTRGRTEANQVVDISECE